MTNQNPLDDEMNNRINNIFSGQDLPAYINLREFEVMKAHIRKLEQELAEQKSTRNTPVAENIITETQNLTTDSSQWAPPIVEESNPTSKFSILNFFRLPEDDDPSYISILQNILNIAFVTVILVLILISGILGTATKPSTLLTLSILAVLIGIASILARRKILLPAKIIVPLALVFSVTFIANSANGLHDSAISGFAVTIIIGGLILREKGIFITALMAVAGIVFLGYSDMSGINTSSMAERTGLDDIFIISILMLGGSSLLRILLQRLSASTENARANEKAQIRANMELRALQRTLEERVVSRTRYLEMASEVGKNVTLKVDNLYSLLNDAVELIRSSFNLYYTQVYIMDPSGRTITLRAGTGDAGKELLKRGHHLLINANSLNSRAASKKQTIIVSNTTADSGFLANPLLPKTRSEMSVPLIVGDHVVGVLDMQSEDVNGLSTETQFAFEALAGQLAIAIQNATLFETAEQTRLELAGQSKEQAYANWVNFLNALDRNEKIGYIYSQNEVLPYVNILEELDQRNTLHIPLTVAGAEIGGIHVSDDPNRKWTASEATIISEIATQLSRHIENLRLLAQSDKYRLEAEQISNRLTREGWSEYLNTRNNLSEGFIYENNKVQALTTTNNLESTITQAYPIYVHDEHIGDLAVDPKDGDAESINEIISVVTQQLSSHIENLRLLEQTQQRSVDLEDAQTFLDSVIENLPNMLFVKNAEDLSFVRWNKAAEQLTGFKRDSLINKNDYDFFPKDEADFFTANDRQVLLNGQVLDIPEEPLATAHLGIRYMHTRKVPIYGADGKAKYLLGVSEDITERKHDQEILAQRANQLETVATVSTTASTVLNPDALLQQVVDLTKSRFSLYHAHIYLLDENWETLLLASGAGEVGKQMVESGHAISYNAEQSLVARSAREKQPVIVNDVRSESGFLANSLLPNTRSEMAIPMVIGDNVLGVFDVQSDQVDAFSKDDANIYSTLASQVAIALQNARLYVEQAATVTQLRELDRLKSSFLANMSHELRTPLNSILGFTDVILEELDGPLTPNMDNDLKLIQKNGKHLLHLINDVLDMAKIESGKMNLIVEKFNLNETITDVMNITSSLANEKSLALFIDPKSDQNVFIRADHTRLRQVLINLMNNGIKFTEKGSVSVRVTHKVNDVLIAIKDTGLGIPADQLDSVFNEFTQVDSSTTRKAGGTGLGLPISRRLIEMHGGKLWAESSGKNGKGSTFNVLLPIEAVVSETTISESFEKK